MAPTASETKVGSVTCDGESKVNLIGNIRRPLLPMLKLHPMHAPFRPGIAHKAGAARMSVKARNSGPEDWLGQMQWGPIEQILRKSRYDEQTIARVCESLSWAFGGH